MADGELNGKYHVQAHQARCMQHLVVLLPVLNEALGLAWVLERIPYARLERPRLPHNRAGHGRAQHGRDPQVAAEYGVMFVDQDDSGKGSAIRHGFRKAVEMEADAVVMLDADGTYAPKEMLRLLRRLDSHEVIIGDRLNGQIEPGAMTSLNFVGNHLLTWLATALFGTTTSDVCSGYWAFSRRPIDRLQLNSQSFEIEAEMFASMVHQRVPFAFVPITYGPRLGEAKLGSTADGWRILRKLITRRIFPVPLL